MKFNQTNMNVGDVVNLRPPTKEELEEMKAAFSKAGSGEVRLFESELEIVVVNKLAVLMSKCKGGVYVTINEHRNMYEDVATHLKRTQWEEEIPKDVLAEMIAQDTIVGVQFYPNTPVGFEIVHHYDLDEALEQALTLLEANDL